MSTSRTVPLTISVDEAAGLLGISRWLAYAGVEDGTIPAVRLGRRIRVPLRPVLDMVGASVDDWLRSTAAASDLSSTG